MLNYRTFRSLIFKINPETAHNILEAFCKSIPKFPFILPYIAKKTCVDDSMLGQTIDGMFFYNPVGLAAGFDKNATMIQTLCALGFSSLELGGVVPNPQPGNSKPRLWRHLAEESLQNAMGLNSQGIELFAQHLKMLYPFAIPLGVNIAKNKTTPQEKALDDYCLLAKNLESCSDYLSINLSSPNTPGLRDLANKSFVQELFIALRTFYSKPLYLKISPDLEIDSILELVEVAINNGANGIIATNTTEDYTFLKNPYSTGGVSGRALTAKSRDILRQIAKVYFKKTTLVSVGGIFDAKEAYERITLGANLIQVYSGLIFEGPKVTWNINHALKELLKSDGLESISQAVGVKL